MTDPALPAGEARDLRALAAGPMTTLRDLTGETVGLSVRVGEELLHIDQVESRSELRRTFEIGKALPLWAGAPSRVLLADLPDHEVERIIRAHRPSQVEPVAREDHLQRRGCLDVPAR